MKFSIFLAGLLATAVVAISGRNDPAEDLLPTAMPALTEGTVCPGIITVKEKLYQLVNLDTTWLNLLLFSKAGKSWNQFKILTQNLSIKHWWW
jgi:hypothetical protein